MKSDHKTILMTGRPGVGKTTLIERVYLHYKSVNITGIITREARENNERVGFRIKDLESGTEGWLAKTSLGNGPRIGKYTVHTADLENVGARALENALTNESSRLIIVDEIGPMEATSDRFRTAVAKLFEEAIRPVLATFRQGTNYPFMQTILRNPSTIKFEVTIDNRDSLVKEITDRLDVWLGKEASGT